MKSSKIIIFFSSLTLLAGCTNTFRMPLTPQTKKRIHSTQMIVGVRKNKLLTEVAVNPQESEALFPVFGLAGELVGEAILTEVKAAKTKDRQKDIEPILASLNHYNLSSEFKKNLFTELSKQSWLKLSSSKIITNFTAADEYYNLAHTKQNTLLMILPSYHMNPQLNGLMISLFVQLEQPNPANPQKPIVLYRNNFGYVYYLDGKNKTWQQAVQAWSKDNGRLIKYALSQGFRLLSQAVAIDMNIAIDQVYNRMGNQPRYDYYGNYYRVGSGRLIKREGNFYMFRGQNNTISILNRNSIISKKAF